WDLWIGAAEHGWQFRHLTGEAFDYRVRPQSMLSALADEEQRRRLYAYVIGKHRDLYWRRLPEVILAAQRSTESFARQLREHLRREAEALAALQAQAAEIDSLRVEHENLHRELAEGSGPAAGAPA